MRTGELRILNQLRKKDMNVVQLADELEMSHNWVSELVVDLEEQNLVEKDGKVSISDSYEARLLTDLMDQYDLTSILSGTKEELLAALLEEPKTVADLETEGFATSTIYAALEDLQEASVVAEKEDGYQLVDDNLRSFLEIRHRQDDDVIESPAGTLLILPADGDEHDETRTAYSAFRRYGIEYTPSRRYVYRGGGDVGMAETLMHAVATAGDTKQMAMCAVFFLRHRESLETNRLWKLANTWDCVERWADLLAFLDQREVRDKELFLPWEEFLSLAHDYDVYPRNKYPENVLEGGLAELGEALDREIDVYLLGGGNLISRGLKDTTKDIDLVLSDEDAYRDMVQVLRELGYEERGEIDDVYEDLDASIILERDHGPRWDIFVGVVADALHLTPGMRERSDRTMQYGELNVYLLSLTDIFVFKAITDREGDLEDCALIARQGAINWDQLMDEIQDQEERTERYFSFAVLDTLDVLAERYEIEAPNRQRLTSYCLENALLLTLDEPKTINDLREDLDFPDHQIYNKLRKLEEEGKIVVDRGGRLNIYEAPRD
jgi:predicted transcriptional regulator